CDVLLVALRPVTGSIMASAPAGDPVRVGAAWIDVEQGNAAAVLPIPGGMPSLTELRARVRHVRDGGAVPTLAAVDLAERQAVAGGYAAPVRRATVTQPTVTYALIGIFVAVYLLEQVLLRRFQAPDAELFAFGGLVNAPGGEAWWRFVSSAFIHDNTSFFHILFNGLAMFWIGRFVEQLYGRLVLVGTFLISAVAGGLVWIGATAVGVETAGRITIGASGGISGLVGLLLLLGRVQGKNVPAGVASGMRNYAVIVIVLNVVLGFLSSGVNNFAHAGGIVAGALLGVVLPPMQRVGGRDLTVAEKIGLIAVTAVCGVALIFAAQSLISALTTPAGFFSQG
ncbi:MAG: rhomboid family intramembrane serine protease, partial [Candidatus Dormibacteria bacterium]